LTFDRDSFERWLVERLGPGHGRRPVAVRDDRILVSKVEEELPARVLDAVEGLPALFDARQLREVAPDGVAPAEAWRLAARSVLERALVEGRVAPGAFEEVMAGIDSVAALVESCCWTCDGTPGWRPTSAERAAFDEVERRLAAGASGLFTRHYGLFDGRAVENYCPGARVARRLFAVARQFLEQSAPRMPVSDEPGPSCPGADTPVP
jgi:hypothetical protein